MADGKGVSSDVAGSDKWEKFEDEDAGELTAAAEGSSQKAINKVITDGNTLPVPGVSSNNSVKSMLGESVDNSVGSSQPEKSSLGDRDVAATQTDRGLADSLAKEDGFDGSETTKPLGHNNLKSQREEIPNKAELEKKRTNWTFFDESSGDKLSAKTTPDRPDGGVLDSKPGVNMVNGSKQSQYVGEISAGQPPKTAVSSEQGSGIPAESKPDKTWVSFGEEKMPNGELPLEKETANDSGAIGLPDGAQTEHSKPDEKASLSIDTALLSTSQEIPAAVKQGQTGANAESENKKTKGWVNFDEKSLVTPNEAGASKVSSMVQDSWVTFGDTKPTPKPDLTSLTISVGLSPQASPVSRTSPSPNPFVQASQGVNPFKPSNPFQVNENLDILLMGGQLTSGSILPASSAAVQPTEPPVTHSVAPPVDKDAEQTVKQVTTLDLLDGIAAAAAAPAPALPPVEETEEEILADYPVLSTNNSWSLLLRFPDKKKRIGSREWKPVVIKLEGCTLQIYEDYELSAPFREVPLQGYFAFSTARLQSHEKGGKVHTVKLEYVKYTEGRKLNHKGNIEHVPSTTPILKLGSRSCFVVREFIEAVTHSLRFLPFYRDRGITYRYNEMFVDVDDVCNVLLSGDGAILKQGSKVLIKIRAFLTGDPECELVLNDAVVKRREEERLRNEVKPQRVHHWIKLQQCEFHKCVDKSNFEESHAINFHPLDACTFELMRFPVKNTKPLPLEVTASLTVLNEQRIELKAEIQLCQEKKMAKYARNNVVFRFPIPDTWVSLFRTSKLFRGEKSIKSTRSHKMGIKSRFHNSKCSIVVSLGSAKYEPEYAAVVWRIDKLPFIHSKVPVDAPQTLICRVDLPVGMECPVDYKPRAEVEYDVSHALVSDTTVVAIKASNEYLPEKWICYRAFYHYDIDMDMSRPTSSPVRDVGCTQQ